MGGGAYEVHVLGWVALLSHVRPLPIALLRRHYDVKVFFQPKAWFDDELCLAYVRSEMRLMSEEARAAGRETCIILDNLRGQTTPQFMNELKKKKCVGHLLPSGVTDELQAVDDGLGYRTKNVMGDEFDHWAMQDNNLARWTAEDTNSRRRDGRHHQAHSGLGEASSYNAARS